MIDEAIELHELGDEHQAVKAMIAREVRKREMWDKIVTSVFGALIIGTCFWVGSHALSFVRYLLK